MVATAGSFVLAIGLFIMFWNLVRGAFKGEPAPPNPWGALTLEWQTSSPPRTENFGEIPVVTDWPYNYGKKGLKETGSRFKVQG
jgi:cytochrome c oxidase subunit 1